MNLEAEKKLFSEQGFIGPIKLWEPEEMTRWWKHVRPTVLTSDGESRRVFNNPMNYDRHLDIDALSALITEPAIVRRFQSLLGPDVLCWRTEFFPKNPGDPGTGWHQVERYAIGEAARGMLEPTMTVAGVPMELTAWIAFTQATRKNGCMKFIAGSHRMWRYDELRCMKWNGSRRENSFFGYDYNELRHDPAWSPEQEPVTHIEMNPGEFIIFTARCIHGSNPNEDTRQRMGFSVRVVPSHVKVYEGMQSFEEFGQHFDLERHHCVLLAGEDRFGHNRLTDRNAWDRQFARLVTSEE